MFLFDKSCSKPTALLVIIFALSFSKAFGQTCAPTIGYDGPLCVGQSITWYLMPGAYCGTLSNVTWSFSPQPSSVTTFGNTVHATWNYTTSVSAIAYYTSSISGSGSVASSSNYAINPAPTVALSISTQPPYCSTVSLVATGSGVGASGNTYVFNVDGISPGVTVTAGIQASADFTNLSAGSHTASVTVNTSSTSGCTDPTSSSISFAVQSPVQPTVTLSGPLNFCASSDPQAQYHATIDNLYGGQASYSWNVNGSYVQNNDATLTLPSLNQSVNVSCTVVIANASAACIIQPNTVSVATNLTPPITPVITNITTPQDNGYYCTGDQIFFTAVGQGLYGNPTYSWSVDNNFIGYSQPNSNLSPPISTSSTASPGVFGPGSSISVSVSGFSGACFTNYPAGTAGLTRSNVPLNTRPQFTGTPIPNSAICSGANTNIALTSDTGGTEYTWTQSANLVSGSSDNTSPASVTSIAQTLTLNPATAVFGTVTYVITPVANGCEGATAQTTVSVNANPATPIVASGGVFSICGAGNILLSAQTGTNGTEVHWFDAATGGNYLGNTNSINPAVSTSRFYYVSSYNTSTLCQSERSTVQAVIKNMYNASVNSVIEQDALVDGLTPTSDLTNQPVESVQQKIQYFDGLGRPNQNILFNNSPEKNDIIQTTIYDGFGRESQHYLPVAVGNDGCPKNNLIDSNGNYTGLALNFYNNGLSDKIADDPKPFAQTIFESSPLNRILKQGASGLNWQPDSDPNSTSDHTIKHHYEYNGATDVLYFAYDPTTGLVSTGSYYNANQLLANRATDEHQNDVIEYVDKLGHNVCKKVQYKVDTSGNKLYASTYYIYDDLGNLVVVLPPEAIKSALSTLTQN